MNIFLCSTVRHLLFSLLKALSSPDKKSYILMIVDQQNIDVNSYNLACLPPYVEVLFIKRAELNRHLLKQKGGRIIKILAGFNIYTFSRLQRYFKQLLFVDLISIVENSKELEGAKLYLFNDRNKLSRLLRLGFDKYSIIEDGLANYVGTKFKRLEKMIKIIMFSQQKKRYFGDSYRCEAIYLLNKDEAPRLLKHKVLTIDFIKPSLIKKYCLSFFNVNKLNSAEYILATQPIAVNDFATSGFYLVVYSRIIKYFQRQGANLIIKTHPREDIKKYKDKFNNAEFIESKVPLELMIVSDEKKCNVISLYSSAGAGFEKYCRRVTLIDDHEIENLKNIIHQWKEDESYLEKRIQQRFDYLFER